MIEVIGEIQLQRLILLQLFLVVSNCAAAPDELVVIDLRYAELQHCHRSIENIESMMNGRSCYRSQRENGYASVSSIINLIRSDPGCVFENFFATESNGSIYQTTLWESAIEHNAYSIFKTFLENGSSIVTHDFSSEDIRDHFFSLVRRKRTFYTLLLEHIKNNTHALERVLYDLEEEGVISTDIKHLIRSFTFTEKHYLHDYQFEEGETLLDEAIEIYLASPMTEEPVVRHRRPLRLLCELDIPIHDHSLVDSLKTKLQDDTCHIDVCFLTLLLSGVTLLTGISSVSDARILITLVPLVAIFMTPIAMNRYSHRILLKQIQAWEQRRATG